ncbi:MAG: hypothetical protein J7499_18410 [Sphingopyxis sp.]|nr:hypothetical protein [Sphingopyxis sp.]
MALEKQLYDIERGFWLDGKAYFLGHVDDRCLLAFPQAGEMHGVRSRTKSRRPPPTPTAGVT